MKCLPLRPEFLRLVAYNGDRSQETYTISYMMHAASKSNGDIGYREDHYILRNYLTPVS